MPDSNGKSRIVILGGGFGGLYTALHLARIWHGEGVSVTLVSRHNYFLMTPLLFEAGSGVLEPRHAVSPLRKLLDEGQSFVEAEVERIDLDGGTVSVRSSREEQFAIEYDHLVLALGGITNRSLIPGSEHIGAFKTLGDAIHLRNHVIAAFEKAEVEKDAARKKAILTFIIVGGGLVAVELAGELSEFLESLAGLYPHVEWSEIRFEMFESAPRIVPELEEHLAGYAKQTLEQRGIRVRVDTRVQRLEADRVHLPGGETIAAGTIILAAGVAPSPIVAGLPVEKDKKGRAVVEATLRVRGRENVWALGDCACIPDPTGKPYPMLAQHALREARCMAGNITAVIRGEMALKPFVYKSKGTLAALGHFNGVGQVYFLEIHGFVAWWVWRTYYLFQMPKWNRRLRIIVDWTIALLFRNDIVELNLSPDVEDSPRPAIEQA